MKLDLKNISVKRPSLKRSSGGSGPGFFGNVYADLRDRRLLIPLAALAVAIVAVPMLLKTESPPAAAPPPAPALEDAAAVTPAVLAEAPGVRNYRKRLAALKRSNPFEQQFTTPPEDAKVEVSEAPDPSVSVAGEETAPSVGAPTSTGSGAPSSPETTVAPPPSEPAGTTVDDGSDADESQTVEAAPGETVHYTGTADITFGPLGEAKRYRGLKRFEMLPDDKMPVLAFLGTSVDADRAYFLVSSEVVETSGDGSCAPQRPAPCQLLELGVGDQRTLTVGTEEPVTYRVKLTDTDVEEIRDPATSKAQNAVPKVSDVAPDAG
jgi:hypothetical protein